MNMLNANCEWVIFIIFLSFMVSVESRNCKKQLDCLKSECCVISNLEYNAIGKCQKLSEEGRSCSSPTHPLRFYRGTYLSSCPCEKDLVCKKMLDMKTKILDSTCVKYTLNFSKNKPGINHKYKREVSDELLKEIRHYVTDFHNKGNDFPEEIPLQIEAFTEDSADSFDKFESESPFTVAEPDEGLQLLWDSEHIEEFQDTKKDEPIPVEDDKQSSTIYDILTEAETTEKASIGNGLEGNVRNFIEQMLNSMKEPPTKQSLLYDTFDKSSEENPMPIDASLNEHDETTTEFSHTDSPDEIGLEETTAESVTPIDYTYLLKLIRDMMNHQNIPSTKSSFEKSFRSYMNDMIPQKTASDNILNKDNGEEIMISRTKSPIELEWLASIESQTSNNQMKQTDIEPVEAMTSPPIVQDKKPGWELYLFQNKDTGAGGIVPSKHDLDDGSLHDSDSLIQVKYSNDEHEKHIDEDLHDPNADYMDEF